MKIESYSSCRNYIDNLAQDCSNSIANAIDYCSLALTWLSHQYLCARGKWNAFCLSFPDSWNTSKSDLTSALQWRHNEHDGVSNHQPHNVYWTVYSGADQRKLQSSASQAFVGGIHRTKGQQRGKCLHLMISSWRLAMWSHRLLPSDYRIIPSAIWQFHKILIETLPLKRKCNIDEVFVTGWMKSCENYNLLITYLSAVQPMVRISSKGLHSRFSAWCD